MINYDENTYLDQKRDLNFFKKEYVGERMMSPIITYDKMIKYYPFEIIDLRFRADHITRRRRFFEEYDENPINSNLYIFLIKHREIKMISDGNKIITVEIV